MGKEQWQYGHIESREVGIYSVTPFRVRATPRPSKDDPLICSVCGLDIGIECKCSGKWENGQWIQDK